MRKHPKGFRNSYSNPWKPARYGLATVAGFVVLLGAWGATAPLSGAVVANGSLQVEGRRQKVQHPYGGIVTAIHVEEGQQVRRGDVLMTLSDTEPKARLSILQHSQRVMIAERARLIAERDGQDQPDFNSAFGAVAADADVTQLKDNQLALMQARSRQYSASVDTIRRQIAQADEQAHGYQAEIEGLERQVDIAEQDVASGEKLLQAGAAPRSRVLSLQGRLSTAQAELGARRSDLAAIGEKAAEGKFKITQLERDRMSEIIGQLQEVDTKLEELKPNLDTARDMFQRTEVRAPATGHVVGLSVFTQGGVIQAGASLMEIVPQDDPLFVEAKLKLSDISDVRTGQAADIRLVGVPRNLRPKINGAIRTVSADSLADQRTGEGYYSLQVSLDRGDVEQARMALQPGMPVQVIVETKPRTLVSYLTSPLVDELTGAFRER